MTVGVGRGHCTSNLNDTDLNSSLLTSSFDINMLTCVVNRSIHWYKCTISPFHCSQPRNTYCHRNLHANVFSSADMDDTDDDDFMLIIVHFKSLYCRSCRWSGLLGSISQRPSPWRQFGGTGTGGAGGADIGCIQRLREQFPVFPQIPPATLNLVFSSLDLS